MFVGMLLAMTLTITGGVPGETPTALEVRASYLAAQSRAVVATVEPQYSPVWDRLAECESNGEWDYGPHSGWGNGLFEGGLQFHPPTWDAFKDSHFPDAAYNATKEQQIIVAERVLKAQGWKAWPACSRKLGLR